MAKHPNDRDTFMALVTFQRDAGNLGAARDRAKHLAELEPDNSQIRALLRQVEATNTVVVEPGFYLDNVSSG